MRLTNFLILIVFCALMIYGSFTLPNRGDLEANLNTKTSPVGSPNAGVHYIQHAYHDAHTPNMVTVTLADYRGYDTLGETTVIFTAALICFLLLRKSPSRKGIIDPPKRSFIPEAVDSSGEKEEPGLQVRKRRGKG